MDNQLKEVLKHMELEYGGKIQRKARNYLEVNLVEQTCKLGYGDLREKYRTASAIVLLKDSQPAMKVRIDGRTFVNCGEYAFGIAVPGYPAKASGMNYRTFAPNVSMICNF